LHRYVSKETKEVSLNGIIVPVDSYPIDKYAPFYELPYHTEDYPLYEKTEVEALREYVTEGDDVVVIGGGFGVTAVVASQITSGIITVFEPNVRRVEILKRTVQANDSENVDINHSLVGEIKSPAVDSKQMTDTEVIPPKELPDADVFEIDCEGAETKILNMMVARPSTILVETHKNHEEVASILQRIGYEIIEVVDDGLGQHPNCTHIRARLS
jgi:hypothetical protein